MSHILTLLLVAVVPWSASGLPEPLREAIKRRSEYGTYARHFTRDLEPYIFAAIPLHPPMPVLHMLSPAPSTLASGKRDSRHAASKHRPMYTRPPYPSAEYTRTFYGNTEHTRPFASSDYTLHSYTPEYARLYSEYQRPSYTQTEYMEPSYVESKYRRPAYGELHPDPSYSRPNSQLSSAEVEYSSQMFPSTMPHAKYSKPAYQAPSGQSTSQETESDILYAKPTAQGGYSYKKEPTKKRKSQKPTTHKEPAAPVIIRVHKYKVIRS